ncbi:MAG: hypothetical protein IJC88_05525 [Oscillospiraceae bacterium]|nr:hypothetical protein [Oscillospiraceae bacterium]
MKKALLSCIATVFLAFGLVAFPQESADAVRNALSLCCQVVIPSLFPFFVLSTFMNQSGVSNRFGQFAVPLMSRLFRLSGDGASALFLGMIGGYPIGADCVRSLYQNGKVSKQEAEHLLIFCNNSGPAFVLGAVGCGVFGSMRIGGILLVIHWLSAWLIGLVLRFRTNETEKCLFVEEADAGFAPTFCTAVKTAAMTMVNVCAFIIFFAVLTELLHMTHMLPHDGIVGAVCTGLFELTSGIAALQPSVFNPHTAMLIASVLLGFGGISVHAQTAALLSETDLSLTPYFLGKLSHAATSFLLTRGFLQFFPQSIPASAVWLHGQTNWPGLAVTAVAILSFCMLLLFSEKRTGNR